MPSAPPRHWLALTARVVRLLLRPHARTPDLVTRSYDRLAPGYDAAWTDHMRTRSLALLDRLDLRPGAACLDLACGTGFVTRALAERTAGRVTGVDASPGMLHLARQHAHPACTYVHADAAAFLRRLPRRSFDVITCAWGLGYTRPWIVVREAARVLRPGGRVGIIDNSLFSLAEVLWASVLTFTETPSALAHVLRVRFLPHAAGLAALMRAAGLAVQATWNGSKTYHVSDGHAAIARLTATGAAAGFEFAADPALRDAIFARFAAVIEQRQRAPFGIPITHRYLAAVGRKR